jgi:hypothetical protein
MKDAKKSAKTTTTADNRFEGFTDEERGAMKEHAQELKAAARRAPRSAKADEESEVLAKIAEMPESDRAIGERLHAIIKATAPALSPNSGTGCRRMPGTARSCASSSVRRSSKRGMRLSASTTRRTSTKAPCGRTTHAYRRRYLAEAIKNSQAFEIDALNHVLTQLGENPIR